MPRHPSDAVAHRIEQLRREQPGGCLSGALTGLEKESLRVTEDGFLARTDHPPALGSALTHAWITTDYSEALLEFITPPLAGPGETLEFLERVHAFAYANLGDELLWATSMPCMVRGDDSVPIARYGSSNVGMMKHVYRRGLGHRYGRVMQTIAGVHFNYSPPESLWPVLRALEGDRRSLAAFASDRWFGLIRNFQRHGWVVPYLFGSSPALCKSFLGEDTEGFEEYAAGTWYQPHATSLRMSDVGYKNKNQAGLDISYDTLAAYVESLTRAIETPHPDYEAVGVVAGGEHLQLNTNVLQIENEYYSFVRPKQIAQSGEKPTVALKRRGVRYVEIRALDVNPFAPLGVDESQMRFMEAFLIHCLLADSPPVAPAELAAINENQRRVATRGREPGLTLLDGEQERSLAGWLEEILEAMIPICELLDAGTAGAYESARREQVEAVRDPSRLPSARVMATLAETGEAFFEFAMRMSRTHRDWFRARPLSDEHLHAFTDEARRSLDEQAAIEASDSIPFEQYLREYFAQSATEEQLLSA